MGIVWALKRNACTIGPNIFLIPVSISELNKSQNFLELLSHQVVPPPPMLKIEILTWSFLWILWGKKWDLWGLGLILFSKIGLKCPKNKLFPGVWANWVIVFGHLSQFDQNSFQLLAKVMVAPPGGQTLPRKFWLLVNSNIRNIFSLCKHFFRVLDCSYQQCPISPLFFQRGKVQL